MNFSKEPYKWINEYIEYFIVKINESNFQHKLMLCKSLNESKNKDINKEFLQHLRGWHHILYRNNDIDVLDYNNFYRCKEYDLPIK